MAALDSSSTLDQIKAAYLDNASYEEDASVSKAKQFVSACRMLLLKLPKRASGAAGSGEIELSPDQISNELNHAREWIAANDTSARAAGHVRHTSFEDFRL